MYNRFIKKYCHYSYVDNFDRTSDKLHKNVYKQLKKKRQDSIVALGKEFVLNLVIIMCASIILQTVLNIISISIIQFLAR